MAVTKPVLYSPTEDVEVSLTRPAQEDLIRKIIQNINMLGELAVIGAVEAYNINQIGASIPAPSVFILCDGGEITESTSPLRTVDPVSRFAPDIRNRYIRGANSGTIISNELGGNAIISLQHQHTPTGQNNPTFSHGINDHIETGEESWAGPLFHVHPAIQNDLNPAEPLELNNIMVAFYLKMN